MPQSCLNVIFATRNLVRMEPAVDLYQTETLNVPVPLDSMEKLVQKLSMLALAILAQTMANHPLDAVTRTFLLSSNECTISMPYFGGT